MLECWQEARKLAQQIYELAKADDLSRDFRLRDQITGAALSVMNNIAEAFDSDSVGERMKFLGYSRRSASEVQACLYVCLDQRLITREKFR